MYFVLVFSFYRVKVYNIYVCVGTFWKIYVYNISFTLS